MCYRTALANREKNMTLDQFTHILDQFPELVRWSPHGYNEPLLHPEFHEFCQEADRRGIRLYLVTNGTLLTKNNIQHLLLLTHLYQVRVSIDAIGERYEQIRGFPYQKLKKRLLLAREMGLPLAIHATIFDQNMHQIPALIELARELSCPIAFSDITYSYNYLQSTAEHCLRVNNTSRALEAFKTDYPLASFSLGHETRERRCYQPWGGIYIDVVGDVFPCTDNLDQRMGNIFQQKGSEIYHSEDYQAFRIKSLEGQIETCVKCNDWRPE